MLLSHVIERNARRHPHREALVGESIRLTHGEMAQRVERTARCLKRLGIGRGERVLVQMCNLAPYVELYFAVPSLGAILVPLNVRLRPTEVHYYVTHSEAKCIVADLERACTLEQNLSDWGAIRERVVVGGALAGWRSYEDLEPDTHMRWPGSDPGSENDVVYIYYTSGTTGRPKGVMWTHRQVIEAVFNLQLDLPLSQDDVSIVPVNMAHGPSILPVVHQVLFMSGKVVLYMGPQFRPETFADLAVKEGARTTLLVPTMLSRLIHLEGAGRSWFRNFRYIKYAAAKMDTEDLLLAVRTMGTRLTQGYGSTETLGGVTYLAPSEHNPDSKDIERRITSAGKEYTNVWVACMDENGNFLRCREVGQIVVKGDKLFKGYWRDPEGTQKVMKDGWFMTGDLGYFDEDDYLYVVDRLSDLIITGGEHVYPQEIEDLLKGFSKVADCAVIGVSDREWGEEVWAFVIPTPGMPFDAEEAVTFCKARMAGYKVPRRFVTCGDLPKNYLGKTQKFVLRERAKGLKEALAGQQT